MDRGRGIGEGRQSSFSKELSIFVVNEEGVCYSRGHTKIMLKYRSMKV